MTALRHILIAVAYTLVAAVVAVALPRGFPRIDPNFAAVIGGIVLLASALLHEIFARQEGEAVLVDHVDDLHDRGAQLHAVVEAQRTELAALRGEIATLRTDREAAGVTARKEVDTVIAEVKVLQGLVEQMAAARSAPEPRAERTGQRPAGTLALVPRQGRQVTSDAPNPPVADGLDDASILAIVRDGLERNRVDLVLQPVVRLPQRRTVFYEAFTRIRDAGDSMLVPEQYIAVAEREGLITAIDNMLLFRCVQLVRRTQSHDRDIGFFCNISAHSLTDRHFFSNFVEFMADNSGLAPNLIFEFPYATIANRDREIEDHLRHLASLGFRFSVDQVSSLNIDYDDLRAHGFRYVKMDAETILAELNDPSAHISVADIKRVIDRRGMDLIVEKIESEPKLLELLDLRIDYGQGYLFGEPRRARVD